MPGRVIHSRRQPSPYMASSVLASSPKSIGDLDEPIRQSELFSSPTTAGLWRNPRLKSYPSQFPRDDDDLILSPTNGGYHEPNGRRQRATNYLPQPQQSLLHARDHHPNVDPAEEVSSDTFVPTSQNGPPFANPRAIFSCCTPSPPWGSGCLATHENTIGNSASPRPVIASIAAAMPSSSPHHMNVSPIPVDRADEYTPHHHHPQSTYDSFGSTSGVQPYNLCEVNSITRGGRGLDMALASGLHQPPPASPYHHSSLARITKSPIPGCERMDLDSPCSNLYDITDGGRRSSSITNDNLPGRVRCESRTSSSASSGSFGKRCRLEEDEHQMRLSPVLSRPCARPWRSYSGSENGSQVYSSSANSIAILDPPLPPFDLTELQSSPEALTLQPIEDPSPCLSAVSRKVLYQTADPIPPQAFRFPIPTPNFLGNVDPSRKTQTKDKTTSFNDESFTRRPALNVAKSSATLFNRHWASLTSSPGVSPLQKTFKSRHGSSFSLETINQIASANACDIAAIGNTNDQVSQTGEVSHLSADSSQITNSSMIEDHDSGDTWRNEIPISPPKKTIANTRARGKKSAAPLDLNYLQPPSSSNTLQSPSSRAIETLGSTVQTPVGMAFSEKERAGKILPCHKVSSDGLMRITPATMDNLLEGAFDESISCKLIIDCRFRYEYNGGHIHDAINVHDKEAVERMFFQGGIFKGGKRDVPVPSESGKPDVNGTSKKVVIVFHCEYSAMRAPAVAKHLREQDRHLNMTYYPALHYPEIYILEGGYAKYHSHSPQHCSGCYVRMDDPIHRSDRQTDLSQFRTQESSNFARAKSFTYGDSNLFHLGSNSSQPTLNSTLVDTRMKMKRVPAPLQKMKENTPVRNKIMEEDEDDGHGYSGLASSPLFMAIAGAMNIGKPNLKAQGRSISMLEKVERDQSMRVFGEKRNWPS